MNKNGKQSFNSRQVMLDKNDFEIFSYSDNYLKNVEYHHHDFYEIYFLLSGNVSYIISGRKYDIEPGNLLLISPNELHQPIINTADTYNRMVLWISRDLLRRLSDGETDLTECFGEGAGHTNLLSLTTAEQSEILRMFENLNEIYHSESRYGKNLLKYSALVEVLVRVNELYANRDKSARGEQSGKNSLILRVLDYISENISEDISLDAVSEKFYLSKYHLCREFKKYMGTTLHRYIVQKRLVEAKRLMREGVPPGDVAGKLGFNDYSNFFKSFKTEYGISPKEYYNNIM